MQDFGFADGSSFAIINRPPRPHPLPYDEGCADKFFVFCGSHTGSSLGRAEVQEAYVYDDRYRAEIDFTGLLLRLMLRPDALASYREFIGENLMPDSATHQTAWHGRLVLRIPVRAFRFPAPRGSSPPIPPAGASASVTRLRHIKTFDFESMDVVKVTGPEAFVEGRAVTTDQLHDGLHLQGT